MNKQKSLLLANDANRQHLLLSTKRQKELGDLI